MKKILLICFFSFLLCYSNSHASYCDNVSRHESKQFIKVSSYIKDQSLKLSNHPQIAIESDKLLSKLAAAKSPVFIKWMQSRNFDPTKDEIKIIQAWREYCFSTFILASYKDQPVVIQKIVENYFSEVNVQAFPKEVKANFDSLFNQAKELSIKRVESFNLSSDEKKQMINKLQSIKLSWFDQLAGGKFESAPLDFLNWGIAYDPVNNEINIGVEALVYQNDESLLAVFAHEIGHSIDPCRWSAFMKGANPFGKVIKCLRSAEGPHALVRDDSLMEALVSQNRLSKELAQSLKDNPTCNKSTFPPSGFQKDQITEVFADWFSAEVIATSTIKLTKKFRNDLCKEEKLETGSSYLPNQLRLEAIYFANPEIQKRLQVKSSYIYCNL